MSQIDMIVDQLRRAFHGEAWHGPALMEILDEVDARTAAARPLAQAHSICELVLHLSAWEGVVTARINGQHTTLSNEQNFGHIAHLTEVGWQQAVIQLRDKHAELLETVARLPESRLSETVPGKDYDLLFMLLGVVQHAAYHGGQIALLKRELS
jgi:uncharacterized damage-inducible protein DinB